MSAIHPLENLRSELKTELRDHILPYWIDHTVDYRNGGFYGRLSHPNTVVADAPKGAVLNTRLLWTFSAAHRLLDDVACLSMAERACTYLNTHFSDADFGGIYWMLDHSGQATEPKKHVYAQAFAIYAYSEFHLAKPSDVGLDRAIELFMLLEKYSYDPVNGGYHEAFSRDWIPLRDVRLSDEDILEERSMNTHLHLLEAFTNLYRIWPDGHLQERLGELVKLFIGPFFDRKNSRFHAFCDQHWKPRSTPYSYGHDIEAAWLLTDAAVTFGDAKLLREVQRVALKAAYAVLAEGVDTEQGGVFNTGECGQVLDTDKHWWAQAEAIVGFADAYGLNADTDFLSAAEDIWSFCRKYIIDRKYGEWHFRVDRGGKPYLHEDKVGPWKCPYHNTRACIEIIRRAEGSGFEDISVSEARSLEIPEDGKS